MAPISSLRLTGSLMRLSWPIRSMASIHARRSRGAEPGLDVADVMAGLATLMLISSMVHPFWKAWTLSPAGRRMPGQTPSVTVWVTFGRVYIECPARGRVGGMISTRVRGGQNQYGFTVGILMLDTQFPRIRGDMGNASTFPFPVRYHRVTGADPDRVVRQGARALLPAFVEGARALVREGVGAITTNCGFLAKFQKELTAAVPVPVFTSSLMLVPLVHRMLAPGQPVGIMSVDATALTPEHMAGAGITAEMPVVIVGLESEKEFTRVMLGNELELDVDVAREEHLRVASRLVEDHPDVGAIVLECTNMPPYTADIQHTTGRPVFDITSLVRMAHDALVGALGPRPA